ncbi:hypothetical protein EYC80_001479 [Monilinia laxa]|uniref:Cytochrome P450 n=1 Tax=Monilinia laxa TaxID=61186 RepID=A0A5N6K503_MONLA|nr:hypothetical protein EYC80_001479 [Monilinia laxa]
MQWLTTGPLKRFFAAKPDMKNSIGQLMGWRDKIINARITEIDKGRRRDRIHLLQSFFEAKTPDGKPLSRADIEAEVLVLLLAGADTTGTAFSSTLTNIISSPDAYSRMMMEIDTGFANGNLSQPIPKAAEVSSHCPFYVSCVKESLRLSPPSPALFPREVTADQLPLIIDGKIIPIGSEVTCSPFLTNRDQEIYGEDADIFRPERWLENVEKAKMFDKYNFTWGYGSRICLGKDLAMMELMKFPLMFFRNFNVELCATSKETPGPPRLVILGGLFHWGDIWFNLKRRKI